MIKPYKQSGFTAVELLITLFVAAAFLVAGYQLFNVIIKDGGDARAESTAGNVAYDYLRRYAPSASNPCQPSVLLYNQLIEVEGLSNARISVYLKCPQGYTVPGLSKIEATITYNTPQQTSTFSTYTNGAAAASSLEISNGLVGWWPLNGNTNDLSPSSNNGTGTSLTSAVGQNGVAGNAYDFNGTSSFISLGTGTNHNYTNFSVSAWAKAVGTPAHVRTIIGKGDWNTTNNWFLGYKNATHASFVYGVPWQNGPSRAFTDFTVTQWNHYVGVVTPTEEKLYMNGELIATATTTHATTVNALDLQIGRASYQASFFQGTIDDVRLYNRTLTDTEIYSLYSRGAR